MADDDIAQFITPTRGAKTLPIEDILTGRGFITGKSGSGKSTTASVIAEDLLENGYNLSIIDPEGEYYALKDEFELLHVGADEYCDKQVNPEDGEELAELTLSQRMPIVIDVSGFLTEEDAQELVKNYVTALFKKEKSYKQPHLLIIEEMHEFLPQSGGDPPTASIIQRVGKRGRKHGLGIMGMSQRPTAVDKDYITQCDWLVWHRLTWHNDVDQAKNILGQERAADIEGLDNGEAFLMTDWDDVTERVQFRKKKTTDAGATPSLEDYHRNHSRSGPSGSVVQVDEESGQATNAPPEPSGSEEVDEFEVSWADIESPDDAVGNENYSDTLEELDRDELETYASQLEQQKQVLSDEVEELRTILRENDSQQPPVENPAPVDVTPGREINETTTPVSDAPTPPAPPEDRQGIAGILIEFVAMLAYMCRVFVFKLRTLFSRGKSTRRE